MPEWKPPPDDALQDSLSEVVLALEHQVGDNPPMEDVIGVSMESLMKHSVSAVATFLQQHETEGITPEDLYQMYIMGFVVGVKFGEHRTAMKE